MGIFRCIGWEMIAYPVDYPTFGDGRDGRVSAAAVSSLRRLDVALHEWAGLLAYRLTGKTSSLFPGP